MIAVKSGSPSGVNAAGDISWSTYDWQNLVPNPRLTEPKGKAVELDYGLHNGQIEIRYRQVILVTALVAEGMQRFSA